MWTPNAVIGLLCLVAAAVVPWIFPDDAGRGMGSALTVLGGMLAGWAPPPPGLKTSDQRGSARIDGLVMAAAFGVSIAIFVALLGTGCGAAQVRAEKSVSLDVTPGPPCVIVVRADGEVVSTVKGPQRCAVVVAP